MVVLTIRNFGLSILFIVIVIAVVMLRIGISCIVDAVKDNTASTGKSVAKIAFGIVACAPAFLLAVKLILLLLGA